MSHTVSIDSSSPDRHDSGAFAAFCDTDGCGWGGEWHHVDGADYDDAQDAAYDAAEADAAQHREDTADYAADPTHVDVDSLGVVPTTA